MPKTDLTKISDADLTAEMQRRAKVRKAPPPPLTKPDFSRLHNMVVEGTAEASRDGYWPKHFDHYIYEAAMEAVYGPAFWPWRNGIEWEGE